ncbi:hypothetical protein NEK97_16625 [Paenarthrobacter sp. UW852]|uniref:hypothetical protein n=1 Tax=Paenarthrobacter sp. UW852 TaxID=2951989 RepID=UPI002147B207|nr:hypothetical protein [Paenarthrobacter sp. UW852]MCR1163090.1 hypothetical protein [Paenarthrobacter sp. UW852]
MTPADMAGTAFRPSALAGYEDWPGYAPHFHRAGSATAQELSDVLGIPAVVPDLGYTIHAGIKSYGAERLVKLPAGVEDHDADSPFPGGFGPVPPAVRGQQSLWREADVEPSAAALYGAAAAAHEETVTKAATLLGSSFPHRGPAVIGHQNNPRT